MVEFCLFEKQAKMSYPLWARDLKILCEGGYELKKVRGVDQFGMTVHTEAISVLTKTSETRKNIGNRLNELF